MRKRLNIILFSCFSIAFFSACPPLQSRAKSGNTLFNTAPTINPTNKVEDANPANQKVGNADNSKDSSGGNEITACSPRKLYRGEILTVSLRQPHGGYSAIRRMKDGRWFFLYDVGKSEPVWNIEEFKLLSEFNINTETAVNTTNLEDTEAAERIFNQTGRYQIMVSDQDFGQCDPLWFGVCEVYYVNKKRPSR